MSLQQFADYFQPITCVLRIEKLPDGSYGNIHIMAGNEAYIRSAEFVGENSDIKAKKFVPDTPYQNYIPKDLNFEEMCFQCAVNKKPMHTYIHLDRFNFWMNIFMMPMNCDHEDYYYCTYSQEFTQYPDASVIAGNISAETAVDVLKICVGLRETSQDFSITMQEIIQQIHNICKGRRCCILLTDFENHTCSVLCEAQNELAHAQPVSEYIKEGFYDIIKTWPEMIAGSSCLILRNQQDMKWVQEKNPVWYENLMEKHVTSMVLFPLKSGSETIGFLWVTNFDTENITHIRETLELTAYFVGSEIANRQLMKRLRFMSSMDSLTGVCNRNQMNQRIDQLCTNQKNPPIGIVFADLNGLKLINDQQGHSAGDDLLRQAGETLRSIFYDAEIYRAGGDEFMIIILNPDQNDIQKRTDRLRQAEISFAVGWAFDHTGNHIRNAMHQADEAMYQDKKLYYQKHPEQKRH